MGLFRLDCSIAASQPAGPASEVAAASPPPPPEMEAALAALRKVRLRTRGKGGNPSPPPPPASLARGKWDGWMGPARPPWRWRGDAWAAAAAAASPLFVLILCLTFLSRSSSCHLLPDCRQLLGQGGSYPRAMNAPLRPSPGIEPGMFCMLSVFSTTKLPRRQEKAHKIARHLEDQPRA